MCILILATCVTFKPKPINCPRFHCGDYDHDNIIYGIRNDEAHVPFLYCINILIHD